MVRKAIPLVAALALLAACSSPGSPAKTTGPSSPAAGSPSASTSSAVSPSAASSASAAPSGSTSSSASAAPSGSTGSASDNPLGAQGQVVLETITQLATQTGVQASSLQLQSSEEVEWSDGSLGCVDPATSYIQVITPGYKMVFTDGTRTYDVHASQNGWAVWCDNGTPKSLTGN